MIILLLCLILLCFLFGGEAILELIIWLVVTGFKLGLIVAAIIFFIAITRG